MQIIDELEPTKRGPYAGAVGYINYAGNMDTAIALRTMVITPKVVPTPSSASTQSSALDSTVFDHEAQTRRKLAKVSPQHSWTVYVQAGAGLVADSVPAAEHQECINKASALLKAVALAERGLS